MAPAPPATSLPPRVLYLVYWGLDAPLGSSLVVPSGLTFAARGGTYSVVSFEKPPTGDAEASRAQIRQGLAATGVAWHPLRYHKTPKWPATAYDLLHGALR